MKFEQRRADQTQGAILAHNISDSTGKRVLRKGTVISPEEIKVLQELGRDRVFVAELDADDISEVEAARRSAELIQGEHIRLVGATTGRTNLLSQITGVLHIDVDRLIRLNELPGVTLSTLRDRSVVPERQMVASIKIIPYGITAEMMASIESICSEGPILTIIPLRPKRVHLLLLGGKAILDKLESGFRDSLQDRVQNLGSKIEATHRIATDVADPIAAISNTLTELRSDQVDLLIMAGETAIMDPRDVIPTAIKRAGGHIETTGAPVDPGNLLMIAYLGNLPILGAPGCARSPKENVVDWILPRMLTGEVLKRADIIKLGHGGLLEDIKERPYPRSKAVEE
jgi:molybdenum cofactor cytidylyltransferase